MCFYMVLALGPVEPRGTTFTTTCLSRPALAIWILTGLWVLAVWIPAPNLIVPARICVYDSLYLSYSNVAPGSDLKATALGAAMS